MTKIDWKNQELFSCRCCNYANPLSSLTCQEICFFVNRKYGCDETVTIPCSQPLTVCFKDLKS